MGLFYKMSEVMWLLREIGRVRTSKLRKKYYVGVRAVDGRIVVEWIASMPPAQK
jgi:hypothetical protein